MLLRLMFILAFAMAAGTVSKAEAQQNSRGYSVKKKKYASRRYNRRPVRRFNREERIGTPEYEDFATPQVYVYGPFNNGPYHINQTLQERVTIGSPDYPVR